MQDMILTSKNEDSYKSLGSGHEGVANLRSAPGDRHFSYATALLLFLQTNINGRFFALIAYSV